MYEKYGDEWEKEVMKNPKKLIVEMLRRVAVERDELEAVEHTLAGGRARVCPECGSEIAVCMMGHYCGEKTPAAKA